MAQLQSRLNELHGNSHSWPRLDSLQKKHNTRNEFDKTINETENAFIKILESS